MSQRSLVIVESPAKAKTISQYLGPNYLVRASYGHVRDLPSNKLGVDPDDNFKVDYQLIAKNKKRVLELKKELSSAASIYLATDPDREGEAIAWHLVEALKPKVPVYRIAFHEITKSAVESSLKQPKPVSQNLVDAQQARRVLDRLVGYKLSPLLWKKVYRGLSAGRVQSVAVRLVIEREREIKAFKSRQYWTLKASIKNGREAFEAEIVDEKNKTIEFDNEDQAQKIARSLKNKSITYLDYSTNTTNQKPKAPLITSTLQQQAFTNFGFSAKRTMKIAQELYEGVDLPSQGTVGLITYMRTDSTHMADQAKRQAETTVAKNFGAAYLPERPNSYAKKNRRAQEAHEAIRPTDFSRSPESVVDFLTRDQARLYGLIYRIGLASVMSPAIIENQQALFSFGEIKLLARGRRLSFDGFLKLIPNSEDRFIALPEITKDGAYSATEVQIEPHTTEPPSRYTEATLIKELEKRGIGRPSTYAPIMSTIVDRGYVSKSAGRFTPELVAEVVTDLLVEHFPSIVDYNFTAALEDQLDEIATGEKKYQSVLQEFYQPFAATLKEKEQTLDKKEIVEEKTDETCPRCGKGLVKKLGRYGQFLACEGYPECKYTSPIAGQEENLNSETDEQQDFNESCPDCSQPLRLKKGRFGVFIGCSNFPKCKYTRPMTVASSVKCPDCQKDIVRKVTRRGKVFWGCSGYPKCQTAFWDEPVEQKCPDCQSLLLKKKTALHCSKCKYSQETI